MLGVERWQGCYYILDSFPYTGARVALGAAHLGRPVQRMAGSELHVLPKQQKGGKTAKNTQN
jgi:hypothetical protein